jgi:hypothetical protein
MHVSRMAIAGLVAALSFASVSCKKEEGPAEKAGRAIDEAAENVQENVEELTGDEGAFEEAGEAADEAVEKTKEAVEDAME